MAQPEISGMVKISCSPRGTLRFTHAATILWLVSPCDIKIQDYLASLTIQFKCLFDQTDWATHNGHIIYANVYWSLKTWLFKLRKLLSIIIRNIKFLCTSSLCYSKWVHWYTWVLLKFDLWEIHSMKQLLIFFYKLKIWFTYIDNYINICTSYESLCCFRLF